MKVILEFFVIYIPIALIFLSVAMVRLFGVQDIGNVIATFHLGGVFSFSHLFLPTFIKLVVICPAIITFFIMLNRRINVTILKVVAYFVFILFIVFVSVKIFIGNFETGLSGRWSNFFEENYSKPSNGDVILGSNNKNIIWIYTESTEKEYKNVEILKRLESATLFMEDFFIEPLVNGYTMGSVVSTRCAAPLFTGAISQNFNILTPFKNALCFDDFLKNNGYHSEFIVGHDATFSSVGNFFSHHGDAVIYDYSVIKNINGKLSKKQQNDEDVLDFSLARILELHKNPQKKFSVTIMTYDNHAPRGFPSERCIEQYGIQITDVIRCNSDSLADFITKIKEYGVLENTVLMIMGDHLFMGGFPSLSVKRHVFSKIYTPSGAKLKSKNLTPFDLPLTVFDSMGFEINVNTFGLGSSGYRSHVAERSQTWVRDISLGFNGPPPPYYIDLHVGESY
ncbi:sulfatase-like hydrolase/transferase [Rheinheimera tangshanensis]|uniref:Sulfatase-like hydrolase/transferase n=1 Tax=Rheinheimera tangshanensis TaxID=400153 RepID=A0A5C8LVZ1_9GAMM|nr:sulfatase-like hydrolase/transferase [Rheinheimera tangshanensis]TXK80514.1 sulfatase-like hydrolase/transferase [Rheinheimera tangshanensis]GGM60696.1 hypothetical protein GCM10010920_21700 [Rheinheimera tangshanensis]